MVYWYPCKLHKWISDVWSCGFPQMFICIFCSQIDQSLKSKDLLYVSLYQNINTYTTQNRYNKHDQLEICNIRIVRCTWILLIKYIRSLWAVFCGQVNVKVKSKCERSAVSLGFPKWAYVHIIKNMHACMHAYIYYSFIRM